MSSTPQGQVSIEVCRYNGEEGDEIVRNPRLLTSELQQLIQRQNIDCSEINCMKWPVVGLSRYATFKCLMMQSDMRALMPTSYTPDLGGYTIRFLVNGRLDERNKFTQFGRMHLADIQPLMVSEYGNASYGEAFYLCTFHCERWAARSLRLHGDVLNRRYWEMGWDQGLQNKMSIDITPRELAKDIIELTTDDEDWWKFFRLNTDIYVDTTTDTSGEDPPETWDNENGVLGMGAPWKMPVLAWLDRMAVKARKAFIYLPVPMRRTESGGGYFVKVIDIARANGTLNFALINDYRNDIIAGSIIDNQAETSLVGFAAKAQIPNLVSRVMRPNKVVVNYRKELPGSGLAPSVFAQFQNYSEPLTTGKFIGSMPDPFNNVPRQSWKGYSPQFIGEAGISFINSDYWRNVSTIATNDVYPEETQDGTDVHERWKRKYNAGICDVWFRGWTMPFVTEDEGHGYTNAWAGCSWVELRLQTDDKGFGYPTTRVYSDIQDPLLGPCEDDRVGDIEASGLVQAWRGEDGRTRVHVGAPFAIPCMITIKSAAQVSTNFWRYSAVPSFKANVDTATVQFKGGIGIWNDQQTIIAYNLAEVNNTSTFAGPGYKLPLVEPGFSVLPVGTDRDGVRHDVTVLAHLCMTHQGGGDRVVAYFHIHNAIDGECETPQLVPDNFDGGFFDGGV